MRASGMSTRRLMNSLIVIGLLFVALTYALGEFLSPPAEQMAQRVRLKATGSQISVRDFRSGVWVRDVLKTPDGGIEAFRFINVLKVSPDAGVTGDWRIFEFDRDYRLRSITTAESGSYAAGDGWTLRNVVETRLPELATGFASPTGAGTQVIRDEARAWRSELRPDIFGVLMVQPERMAGWDLAHYIQHLSDNRQQTERYEIALWSKLFYPWAVLVMMALALPFAYLHVRAGGLSLKIFTGVMIGVGFYGLNKLFAHLGLLNTWPPIVVAALPSLVVLALAMTALYWIERR
jgi:lipopolysaccharide export system permease protein